MSVSYADFIAAKEKRHGDSGFEREHTHDVLKDFQRIVTKWNWKKGKACNFLATGLGKTPIQCATLDAIPGRKLIVAPLGVTGQTIEMAGRLLNMEVRRVREPSDVGKKGLYIVNYDRLERLEGISFEAVGLDESSILKSHDGGYRRYIQERFAQTPYRFCFTATPAPNDYMELGTHAEFVGAMSRQEMLATFFIHDGGETSKWRLKRHGVKDFWQWVSSWACVVNLPSDIGCSDEGYLLPDLTFHEHRVHVESNIADGLFSDGKVSATGLYKALGESSEQCALKVAEQVSKEPDDPWLIWCNTNAEQSVLAKLIPNSVSVQGSDDPDLKEDRLLGFASGKYQHLITKPTIAGFGLNFQRSARGAFCGATYSFEQFYQAIRRQWRFGQSREVHIHIALSNALESVVAARRVKEEAFVTMAQEMRRHVRQEVGA